jgi:hypothetical protein
LKKHKQFAIAESGVPATRSRAGRAKFVPIGWKLTLWVVYPIFYPEISVGVCI